MSEFKFSSPIIRDGGFYIKLFGRLDLNSIRVLDELIRPYYQRQPSLTILDVCDATIDGHVLQRLHNIRKIYQRSRIKFVNVSEDARTMFDDPKNVSVFEVEYQKIKKA